MAESYQNSAMAQSKSPAYIQQDTQGLQQTQQYRQHGEYNVHNQGQSHGKAQTSYAGNEVTANTYGQDYSQSQNSYHDGNNTETGNHGQRDDAGSEQQSYGNQGHNSYYAGKNATTQSYGGAQQQPHLMDGAQGQDYGEQSQHYYEAANHSTNQGPNYAGSSQQQYPSINGSHDQTYGQQSQNFHQTGNNATNQGQGYASQNQGYQQPSTTGMNGQAGQSGAQYPDSKAPDTMHIWLDKIEKKFGGERFDETKHPENAAKNKALNENIIKKLTQVMKIVMQRGPKLAMQYGSKLF